jgi:hypothetical protein
LFASIRRYHKRKRPAGIFQLVALNFDKTHCRAFQGLQSASGAQGPSHIFAKQKRPAEAGRFSLN